jgi:RimJ/RimL family protein N-acetyltransferase
VKAGAPVLSDGVVLLRALAFADAADHLAGEDEELWRWLSGRPGNLTVVTRFIERNRADWARGGPRRNLGVCDVETDTLIGNVEANLADPALGPDEVNLSYVTFPPWRGRGIAARAVSLLCSYLSSEELAATAVLRIEPANVRSLAVARKAGFEPDGDGALPTGARCLRFVRSL